MLQGSLENFALDEVLGLLSGTSKTGHLEIAGNRGTGNLVFHEGRLVDGTSSFTANGTELEDVMFELLRYADGTFTFSAREVTPTDLVENVATVLANAESRLQDWRSIETVVPSLNHQVIPVLELPSDEVTVSRDEWATLMTVGSGCPVSHVCERLTLGEVEGSRRIKNLAERQLVDVTEPIASVKRVRVENTETVAPPVAAGVAPIANVVPIAPVVSNGGAVSEASNLEALAGRDISGAAKGASTGSGAVPSLSSLMADRPPMPSIPAATDLAAPPGPPSPAEIAGFGERVEDASELMETVEEARGGILARYLKGDD